MAECEPRCDVDEPLVAAWRLGQWPSPRYAWVIGEALSRPDRKSPAVQYASGLVALCWFGYEQDVVGILGLCPQAWVMENEALVVAMIHSMGATADLSPYELVDESVVFGDDNPVSEDGLIERERRGELCAINSAEREVVAERLENRRLARKIWNINADARRTMADAAGGWMGDWIDARIPPARPIDRLDAPMQYAYAVASSELGPHIKAEFFIEYVQRWIYEVVRPRPQSERSLRLWHDLMHDPRSTVADNARIHMDIRLAMGELQRTIASAECFDFYGALNEISDHVLRLHGLDPHDGTDPWMHGFAGKHALTQAPCRTRLVLREEEIPDDSDIQF